MSGYVIIIERADDGGFGARRQTCPIVCCDCEDYDTGVAEMREAIRFHLDGMREDSDPIPSL